MSMLISTLLCLLCLGTACRPDPGQIRKGDRVQILSGAEQLDSYHSLIRDKQLALVANHTSLVGGTHLVDTLLSSGLQKEQLLRVFAPEHGFRGDQSAGDHVADGKDPLTGIPVVSLYGAKRKPGPEALEGVDLVLFDLQDVGARFYTYISTLHYVMEACAENGIPLVVLDRPNPNRGYVDGPVLEAECLISTGCLKTHQFGGVFTHSYQQLKKWF